MEEWKSMFSGKDLAGTSLVVLLWWLSGKSTPADAGDVGGGGSIPSWGRSSGVGNGNPLQYYSLGDLRFRDLGYSPWGHNELGTTECTLSPIFLVVQWLRLQSPSAEGPGLIPDWGTRSHIPQLFACCN